MAKKLEPSFIMTMDGINDNYFKDAAKAKTNEEKPQLNSLAGGRLRVLLVASLRAEPIQKTVKIKEKKAKKEERGKKANVHEKPTMNVISNPSANQRNREESSQPVAAVKPIQEQPVKSKEGMSPSLLHPDKLSEIKAAKAAKLKEETSKESWGFLTIYVFSYLSLLNCKSKRIMNEIYLVMRASILLLE